MIICLSLWGVSSWDIGIDLCEVLLFKNDIRKHRFFPNFRFPKTRFVPWHIILNNALPKDSSLSNILSYSNIWLILLRLGFYQNLRFKKIGSCKNNVLGSCKNCCNTVVLSILLLRQYCCCNAVCCTREWLYQLIAFFSKMNKLRLGDVAVILFYVSLSFCLPLSIFLISFSCKTFSIFRSWECSKRFLYTPSCSILSWRLRRKGKNGKDAVK